MKWNTAIKQIEQAMAEGRQVGIEYHRKWERNSRQFDVVYSVSEYDWNDDVCKGVTTYYDILDEDNYIIDGVVINDMTKRQMIKNLADMANQLVKNYTYDLNKRMWTACLDWNREHPDEEIFMCEDCFNGSETVNGFYIEDDYWIIPD